MENDTKWQNLQALKELHNQVSLGWGSRVFDGGSSSGRFKEQGLSRVRRPPRLGPEPRSNDLDWVNSRGGREAGKNVSCVLFRELDVIRLDSTEGRIFEISFPFRMRACLTGCDGDLYVPSSGPLRKSNGRGCEEGLIPQREQHLGKTNTTSKKKYLCVLNVCHSP